MLNKVMLIGRLGRDPELRYTQTGDPVCTLHVATDESYTNRDGTRVDRVEWHRVITFQRSAENCNRYLSKGSLVYVEGSLQTRKWQDPKGQERYMTEIKAQRIRFLDRRSSNDTASMDAAPNTEADYAPRHQNAGNRQTRQPRQYQQQQQQEQYEDMGPAFPSEASSMDDMPF